jgi:Sec7-like guanine-nucleotide exchange factor
MAEIDTSIKAKTDKFLQQHTGANKLKDIKPMLDRQYQIATGNDRDAQKVKDWFDELSGKKTTVNHKEKEGDG